MKNNIKFSVFIFLFIHAIGVSQIRGGVIKTSANGSQNPIEQQIIAKAKEQNLGNIHSESATMRPTAGDGGYFLRFEKGWVYYNPNTKKAHAIYGDIMKKWGEKGYETGELGFPTSDEIDSNKPNFKRMNTFDKGTIYWKDGITEVVKSNRISNIVDNAQQETPIVKTIDLSKFMSKEISIERASGIAKYKKEYKSTNKKPKVEQSENENCTTTYKSLSVTDIKQDILSKAATSNVILGGAYNLSDFSQTGKMNIYEGNGINPISIMLKSARLKEGTNNIEVKNVSALNLSVQLENLLERDANGQPTQNFVKTSSEVFSSKDLKMNIGLNLTGLGVDVDDKFKYDYNRKTRKYLIDYKCETFTAEAFPSQKYFKNESLNSNKDIVYVDKITYGQRILISYELEDKSTEIDNQLNVKYSGQSVSFDTNLKNKYKDVVFKMLAYGTNGDAVPFEVKGLEELQNQMNEFFKNAIAKENRPAAFGAPISFSLKFLDGTVAVTNAKIETIPFRECTANEKTNYQVTLKMDRIVGKGDAQMYGWVGVKAFSSQNEIINEKNNKDELIWNVSDKNANQNFEYSNDVTMSRNYIFSKNDIENGAYLKLIYSPREEDTHGDDFFHLENFDEQIQYNGGSYKAKKILIKDFFSQDNNLKQEGFEFNNKCSETGDSATFYYKIMFK